jgi:hypothetical protein
MTRASASLCSTIDPSSSRFDGALKARADPTTGGTAPGHGSDVRIISMEPLSAIPFRNLIAGTLRIGRSAGRSQHRAARRRRTVALVCH